MRFIDVQQDTPEWLEMRFEKIGASDCPTIMRESGYGETPLKLYWKKKKRVSGFCSQAMQKGKDLEPIARELASKIHNTSYIRPKPIQHPKYDWMIASIDGYDPVNDKILEIKMVNKKLMEEISIGNIPSHFQWQLQHQMEVSGHSESFLFSFLPETSDPSTWEYVFSTVSRDESKAAELIEAESDFMERMINFEPPEEIEEDVEVRMDDEYHEAETEWKEASEELKNAEIREKICRDSLIYLSNEKSTRGKIAYVKKCKGKETVDYKKVPELTGIDLTPYKKIGSPFWKVMNVR